jgi:hypothetical protein
MADHDQQPNQQLSTRESFRSLRASQATVQLSLLNGRRGPVGRRSTRHAVRRAGDPVPLRAEHAGVDALVAQLTTRPTIRGRR